MTDFQRVEFYYKKGWASKEQLRQYVQFYIITSTEYQTITGEIY
jgi:hypothetical protein